MKVNNISVKVKDSKIEFRNVSREKDKDKFGYLGTVFINGKKGSTVYFRYKNVSQVKKELERNYKYYKY